MVGCGVVISASPSPGCHALASLDWPQCGLVRRTIITQLQRYHLVPLHLVTDTLLCRVWCQCHTDLELGMGVVLIHFIYNLNLLENHYSYSEQQKDQHLSVKMCLLLLMLSVIVVLTVTKRQIMLAQCLHILHKQSTFVNQYFHMFYYWQISFIFLQNQDVTNEQSIQLQCQS